MSEVEDFIYQFEGKQRAILLFLHHLMAEELGLTTKIRYKIPFYDRKSWICYLNPGKKENDVELCFIRGNELSNLQGILEAKNRKQVRGLTFSSIEQIPKESLTEIIQEAILLDETKPYESKRKKSI